MKSTGIVRPIDQLGRIVLPKELRDILDISPKDCLEVFVENEKIISLCHSWRISDVETELSDAGWAELDRLGVRLMISGHTHQCRLIGEADDREKEIFGRYPNIIGYMDGGKSGENYIASKLTLSADGISLYACNMNGEEIFNEQFAWIAG